MAVSTSCSRREYWGDLWHGSESLPTWQFWRQIELEEYAKVSDDGTGRPPRIPREPEVGDAAWGNEYDCIREYDPDVVALVNGGGSHGPEREPITREDGTTGIHPRQWDDTFQLLESTILSKMTHPCAAEFIADLKQRQQERQQRDNEEEEKEKEKEKEKKTEKEKEKDNHDENKQSSQAQ